MRVIDALAHGAKHGEKRMSAAEGELAMVRLASRRWRSFLLGRENYWVTDSQKMASLLSSERMSSNPRLVRTANELLEFQFSPIHVAGDRNVILDTLSRLDHLPPDEFHLTDVPLADIQSAAAQWVDRTAAAMRAATQTLLLMDAAQPVAPPASGALLVPRPAAPAADAIAVRWRTLQQGDPSLAALRATAEAARVRSSTVATLQDASAAAVLRDAPRPPLSQRTDRRVARYDPRGLLYVGERRAADTRLWIWRAVVPAPLRRQQALLTHADPLAGHFSASKTAESLLRTQWWPGLRETVRQTVDACRACQMSQQPRQPLDGGDLERLVGDRPIRIDEVWQCDTFTHASQKFFHIIDLFSSFHWVVPVPDGRAASCREALLMAISHGGRPRICSFDGGKEFAGGFRSILLGLGIEPHVGIPYHPNSQSAVERGHRSLRASLASMKAMALQLDVDESPTAAMARAVAALNMTAGGAANSPSPYEKRTGVAPVPAACIDLRPLLVDPDADLSAQDRAAIVDFQLMKASQDAARTDRVVQRSEHRARLERRQNGERPPMAFAPHDRVRVLRAIGTGGLESEGRADADVYRFVGPYRVEEVDPIRRMVTVKLDIPLKFGETEEEDAPRVMLQRRSVHESIVRHYHEETDAELPEDMRYDPTSGAVMLKPPGVEWPSQSDVDERIFNALPPGLKKLAERRRRSAGRAAEREQRQAEAARKAEEERRLAEERRRERMRLLEEAEKERESRRRSEAESNEEKNKIVKISGVTNLRGSDKFIVSGTTSNGLPVVKAYDVCDEDEKSIADAFRGKPAPVVPADRSVGRPKRTRRRPAKFKRSAERIWDDGLDEEERADGDDEWVGETSDEE
jgi:transposase InsO family protein